MKLQNLTVPLLILLFNSIALGQWPQDLSLNLPICTQTNEQVNPLVISDGYGGTIILWEDLRDGDIDLYAQRVTQDGQKLWQENGIPIVTTRGDQLYHSIVENGNGGAYIAWISNDYIYAQQISSDGQLLWNQPIRPSSNTEEQHSMYITSDHNNGCIIAFISGSVQYWNELIVQRINSNGDLMWGDEGEKIISDINSKQPRLVGTSEGGAIIFFEYGWVTDDYYVQIIDQNGNKKIDGVGTHINARDNYTEMVPKSSLDNDGLNGAIVACEYYEEIFANRVDTSGTKLWGENGIIVCEAGTDKYGPQVINDGKNGAYIAWYDAENLFDDYESIYVQHIDSSGQKLFTSSGIPTVESNQQQGFWYFSLQTDNLGGFILSWETNPSAMFNWSGSEGSRDSSDFVWVQRMTASGVFVWPRGLKISTTISNKHSIVTVSSGNGGIIAVWVDKRNGNSDIYAQRVDESTVTSIDNEIFERPPYTYNLFQNFPNPFNPNTTIKFSIPKSQKVILKVYDLLGKEISVLIDSYLTAGTHEIEFNAENLSSGVYFYKIFTGKYTDTKKLLLIK